MTSDMTPESPEIVAFATRMYDAARQGDGMRTTSDKAYLHKTLWLIVAVATFEQALPAGLPANMTNDKGDSLLMLASYHGHLPLSRLLLQQGADPNRLNDRGQSPLAGVVFKGEDAIVDLLLENGADVDAGQPSAMESIEIFKKKDVWGEKFERAREALKQKGKVTGPGGTKESTKVL